MHVERQLTKSHIDSENELNPLFLWYEFHPNKLHGSTKGKKSTSGADWNIQKH